MALSQPAPNFATDPLLRRLESSVATDRGLLRSLTTLLDVGNGSPDHTTFSRRSPGLALAPALARAQAGGPVHVVIDATGLKVYGAGEGLVEKHGARGKRTWWTLHLAVDPSTGAILASELTSHEEGDASQVGPLLEQIPGPLGLVTADGADDGEPVYRAVAERQPDPPVAVIIPPRSTAVPSLAAGSTPSQRDQHIQTIRDKGRLGWQEAVGSGRRALGETAMFRYKAVIGRGLRARTLPTSENGSPGWLLGAEPDGSAWHASAAAHRLKAPPSDRSASTIGFAHPSPNPSDRPAARAFGESC